MGVSHRMVLGYTRDAREGATFLGSTLPEQRMIAELDRDVVQARQAARITAALARLKASDRAFARKVLAGLTWHEMGMSRQLFSYRMKKILKSLSPLKNKGETHVRRVR